MSVSDSNKASLCVHAGTKIDPASQGVNTPVYTSSSYGYLFTQENQYPRYFNTINQKAVVEKLCALEGAENGILVSSGMAAISTILLGLLKSGDHVIFQKGLYGGTHFFVNMELERLGISYTLLPDNSPEAFSAALQNNTKMVYLETPSNPRIQITNISQVVTFARQHQLISVMDNTFASPINQNPIRLGVDLVLHSGTKYLGGHGDLCFGAIVTSLRLFKDIHKTAVNMGGSVNGMTAYLIERSMKTLAVRVRQQNENAMKIARFLQRHPRIKQVHYPGLESHPGHAVARQQMYGFGGMLAFELTDDQDADAFQKKLKMIFPALSLGGVETIISSPVKTSHLKLTPEERELEGITANLLRLSVGIESADDLIIDLQQALDQ
ncbi:MAG: trans-sulfuration enzyme family protein [Candidatus Cyclobacteriaceae bacterium M3_2C_046]